MLTERRTPPPADDGSTCSSENRVTGHTGEPPEVLQGGSARVPPAWPGVRRFVNRPILATDMLTRGGPLAQVVGKAALHGELALTNDDIAIRNETYVPRRPRTEEVDIGNLSDAPEPVRGYYGVALYVDLRDRAEPTTGVVEATQGRRRVAPAFGAVNIFRGALAAATRTTAPEGPDTTPASSTTPSTTRQTSPAAPAAGPSADDPWQRYSVQIQRATTAPARLHALADEKAGLDAAKSRPEFRAIVRATDVWTKPSHPRTGELLPTTSSSVTYERDDDVHAVMLMAADLPEDFARSARSRDPNSTRIDQHLGVSHVPDPRRERRGLTVLSTAIMATALRGQALVPNLTEFLVALFGMPQEQARPEEPETVPGLSVVDALFLRDPKLRRFFTSADALRAVVMREGMILFNLGTLLCRTIDFLQDFRRPEIMSRYDWPTRLAFDELGQPPAPDAVHQVAPFHFGNITVHRIPTELCAEFPEEGPQLPATVQPWSPPPREQWIRTPEGTVKPFAKAVIYLRRADNTEDPRAVALQHHEIVQNLLGLRGEPGTAPLSTYGHYIGPHALVTKLGRSPDLDETRRFYAAAGVDYDSLSSSRPLPARPDVYGIFPLTDDGVSMQYATAFFVAMGANLHASDPTSFEALHPTISRLVQETCCMGPGGGQPAFMTASEEPRTTRMSDGAYFVSTELQSQLASLDLQAPSPAQLAACIRAGILHGTQFWRSIRFHRCPRGEEPSLDNLWAVPIPKAFTIGEADGRPRLYVDESTLREHVASFGLDVAYVWLSAHRALTHSTDSNNLRDPLRRRYVEALLQSRAYSTASGHTAWETLEAWLRTVFGDYTLRITVAGPLEYDAVTNSVSESVDITTTFQTADPLTYWRDESPKRKGDVFLCYDAGLHWDERTRFHHWNSVNNKRVWVALPPRPGGGPSGGRPPGPPGSGGGGGRDGAGGKRKGDGGKGKGPPAASTSTSSSASVSFPSANSSATTSSKKPRTCMGRKKLRRLEAASARATRGDASTVAVTTETVTLSTAPGTTTAPSESAAADGTASASSEYETAASDISEGDNGEPVRIARAALAPGFGLSGAIKRYLHTMVFNEFRYVVFLKTAYTWMDHHAVPPLQFLAGCGEREERGRTRGAWYDRDFVAEVDNTDWGQFKASHEFVINRMTSLASYIMRTTARWACGNKSDEAAAAMEIHRQATFYLTVVSNACGRTTRDTLRANAVPPLDPRAMHPDLPKETALTVPDTVTWYTRLTGVNRDVFDSTVSELAKFVNDFNNTSQSFELPCDKRRPLHVPIEDHAAVNVIYANRTTLDDDRRFNDLRHDARRSKHINSNLRQLRVEAATRVAEAKGITLEAADASLASIDVDGILRMLVTVAAFEKPYLHMRFGEGPRKQRTVLQKSGVGAFGKHRDTPLVMSAWQPSRSRTLAEERRARKRDRRGHDGPGPPTEQEAEVRSSDGDDGDDAAGQSTSTAVQRALRRKLHVLRLSRGTDAISRQMRVDRNMLTSSTDPHFVFQPAGLPLLSRVLATRTDSTGRPLTEIPSTFMILAQELAKQVLDAVGGDVGEQLAAQVLKTAAARQEQSWMDRLRATRLVVEGRIAALGTNGWAQESKPVQILIDSGAELDVASADVVEHLPGFRYLDERVPLVGFQTNITTYGRTAHVVLQIGPVRIAPSDREGGTLPVRLLRPTTVHRGEAMVRGYVPDMHGLLPVDKDEVRITAAPEYDGGPPPDSSVILQGDETPFLPPSFTTPAQLWRHASRTVRHLTVHICNPSRKPLELAEGTIVGYAEFGRWPEGDFTPDATPFPAGPSSTWTNDQRRAAARRILQAAKPVVVTRRVGPKHFRRVARQTWPSCFTRTNLDDVGEDPTPLTAEEVVELDKALDKWSTLMANRTDTDAEAARVHIADLRLLVKHWRDKHATAADGNTTSGAAVAVRQTAFSTGAMDPPTSDKPPDEKPPEQVWKEALASLLGQLPETQKLHLQRLATLLNKNQRSFTNRLDPRDLLKFEHSLTLLPDVNKTHLPLYTHPRRMSPTAEEATRKEIEKLLRDDLIEPSQAGYGSPVVLAPKKDGTLRFCIDYRKLNLLTERDVFPLPRIDDQLERLRHARVFSTCDATSGFWQLPLSEESRKYTTFLVPWGCYQWKVTPFGVMNGPSAFCRAISSIMGPLLSTCVVAYVDDLTIFSSTVDQHLLDLEAFFAAVERGNLKLKPSKCRFMVREIELLGHRVSGDGVRKDKKKMDMIAKWPEPNNVDNLHSFVGLTGYYRRFVRNYARIAQPLYDILKRRGSAQSFAEAWTDACREAFKELQRILIEDAMGAILHQADAASNVRPLTFSSRTCSDSERNYGAVEGEAMTLLWALKQWHHYFECNQPFEIHTDHEPLLSLRNTDLRQPANRYLAKVAMYLQGYNYTIKHCKGTSNSAPDALTRAPLSHPVYNGEADGSENAPGAAAGAKGFAVPVPGDPDEPIGMYFVRPLRTDPALEAVRMARTTPEGEAALQPPRRQPRELLNLGDTLGPAWQSTALRRRTAGPSAANAIDVDAWLNINFPDGPPEPKRARPASADAEEAVQQTRRREQHNLASSLGPAWRTAPGPRPRTRRAQLPAPPSEASTAMSSLVNGALYGNEEAARRMADPLPLSEAELHDFDPENPRPRRDSDVDGDHPNLTPQVFDRDGGPRSPTEKRAQRRARKAYLYGGKTLEGKPRPALATEEERASYAASQLQRKRLRGWKSRQGRYSIAPSSIPEYAAADADAAADEGVGSSGPPQAEQQPRRPRKRGQWKQLPQEARDGAASVRSDAEAGAVRVTPGFVAPLYGPTGDRVRPIDVTLDVPVMDTWAEGARRSVDPPIPDRLRRHVSDATAMTLEQRNDPWCQRVRDFILQGVNPARCRSHKGLDLVEDQITCEHCLRAKSGLEREMKGYEIVDGVVRRLPPRPGMRSLIVVPETMREAILEAFHDDWAHRGADIVTRRIITRFWWDGMTSAVHRFVRTCKHCQSARAKRQPKVLCKIIESGYANDLHQADIAHLDLSIDGHVGVFLDIDAYTKWPEAIPIKDEKASTMRRCGEKIYGATGIIQRYLIDNGSQLKQSEWYNFWKSKGTRIIRAPAFHQSSNGGAERLGQTFKRLVYGLCKAAGKPHNHWSNYVHQALLAMRTGVHAATGFPPAVLHFGRDLALPGDLRFDPDERQRPLDPTFLNERLLDYARAAESREAAVAAHRRAYNKRILRSHGGRPLSRSFKPGEKVLCWFEGLKRGIHTGWTGPFVVLRKLSGGHIYEVKALEGAERHRRTRAIAVHLDLMIPYRDRPEHVTRRQRVGRPPKAAQQSAAPEAPPGSAADAPGVAPMSDA
eukprot:tig00021758_g23409.t1